MKAICVCVILFCGLLIAKSSSKLHHENTIKIQRHDKKTTFIDILIEDVRNERWDEEELPCYLQVLMTLDHARNSTLWATWVLDSMQLPVGVLYGSQYQLGNFDECIKAPWAASHPELNTQYCLADIRLTDSRPRGAVDSFDPYGSAEFYINTRSKHGRELNIVTWGVCMPAVCKPRSISKFLKILFLNSHLNPIGSNSTVTVESCQEAGITYLYSTGFYVSVYITLAVFMLALISTIYIANRNETTSNSVGADIAKSFCMRSNGYDLVKESRDEVHIMHGMRTLTACIMIFVHNINILNSSAVSNGLDVDKDLDFGSPVLHVDLLTDTFFMMSGLLLAKGFMSKWDKPDNPFLELWKRYIRLIGPFAVMVVYMGTVSIHAGNGPLWARLAGPEQSMCADNWWLSLLMLNNYINSSEICYFTTWYIPVDYHLAVLGTALLCLYRYHRRCGLVAFTSVAVFSILVPGAVIYLKKLPAVPLFNVESLINVRRNIVFISTYMWSHHRGGAYLVGMATGYLMAMYKPAQYRNVISKKLSVLSFTICFTFAIMVLAVGGNFYTREYNALEAACFGAVDRVLWAIVISVLILISEYGDLPLVNDFLGWSAFVPLSRLSYGLYLVHPALLQRNAYAARSPLRHDLFSLLTEALGAAVLGYIFSLLMWLLVQAPLANLTKIMLHSKRTSLTTDSDRAHRQENGKTKVILNGKSKIL